MMILDENDPSGLGLFSRCARNQACKNTKSRPHTAGSRKSSNSQIKIQQEKKKNGYSDNWFEKQQSRQQRQKKYQRQYTPSVGQYNPTIKDRPKLVWDVIKIYQKKNKQMKRLQQIKQKINKSSYEQKQSRGNSGNKFNQIQQNLEQSNAKMEYSTSNINKINYSQEDEGILKQKSLDNSFDKKRQKTTSSNKSSCVVNMSRMTGRISVPMGLGKGLGKNSLTIDTNSRYFDEYELNKSIQRIKSKTTKNIYFKKMIGRRQMQKTLGTANIYDCKVDFIKPRKSAQMNFGIIKGRQESPKKISQSASSYTHYDFNEYVWKSTSSVYPNTKKNLISFEKQR